MLYTARAIPSLLLAAAIGRARRDPDARAAVTGDQPPYRSRERARTRLASMRTTVLVTTSCSRSSSGASYTCRRAAPIRLTC